MNAIEQLAAKHPGFGAAPFQRAQRTSPIEPPAPPPTFVARPQPPQPQQPVLTATQTLHRTQVEQALPLQSSVGSDYRWATLNVAATIGGHTFQAGTRIAVAPSQTSTSGGGKAHLSSQVTKVWAKFGQTFDASSWLEGSLSPNLFTYTGQAATWSSSTGFGAIDTSNITAGDVKTAAASGGLGFVGGLIIGGLIGGIATATVMYLAEQKEEAIYRRAGYSGR